MTSSHKHTATGKIVKAGDIDATVTALVARVAALEANDEAQDNAIGALAVRVTALEAPVVVPPVDPPPIVLPFPGFAKAEAAVSPGGTIDVPPGIYKEMFTATKPGVIWNHRAGSIIDLAGFVIPVQKSGIVINGDEVQWIGQGEIKNSSASAIEVNGARVKMTSFLHHNVEEGYVWHGPDGLMLDGENAYNNMTGQMWDSSEQGAGKANCQRLVIDGVYVHHIGLGAADASAGQGLWYDSIGAINTGGIVRNCRIHDVYYAGLFFEISQGGKFYDNVVYRCGTTPSGNGFWGAGILVASSRTSEVYSNVVADCKYNGVRVLCQNRGDRPGDTVNVLVRDNTFFGNGVDIGFDTDNAAIQAVMFAANSGNGLARNRFATPKVFWKPRGTLTDIASINTLPGGGGNTVLTAAEVSALRIKHGVA